MRMTGKLPYLLVVLLVFCLNQPLKSQYVDGYNIPDSTYLWSHLPNKATFLSALVPGLGQIYNEKYWKVPIIYAGFTGFIYYAHYNNYVYKKYKRELDYMTDNDTSTVSTYPLTYKDNIIRYKDTWRRYRDICFIGIGVLYIAQVIDADVDAYLFDFDVNNDLSMKIEPMIIPPQAFASGEFSGVPLGVRCTIRF
jgi:hypothetical protein